mmetsp:Transcript_53449/g.60523  ORF Transcript_53449/g.60523 Transcript_53449/m.60523 type:complete len:109 (+) Transcript_53449:201-527(+)
METTSVDNATTIASPPAVQTDDADNGDKPVVDQTCTVQRQRPTEDPTMSSTGDRKDVEDAATAKSTVTAERRKTEDADTAVDDDIADSVCGCGGEGDIIINSTGSSRG